jgi:hypothetical protein
MSGTDVPAGLRVRPSGWGRLELRMPCGGLFLAWPVAPESARLRKCIVPADGRVVDSTGNLVSGNHIVPTRL